jgi:hypothetical protein
MNDWSVQPHSSDPLCQLQTSKQAQVRKLNKAQQSRQPDAAESGKIVPKTKFSRIELART